MITLGNVLFWPLNHGTPFELFSLLIFLVSVIIMVVLSKKRGNLKKILLFWLLGALFVLAIGFEIWRSNVGGFEGKLQTGFGAIAAGVLWFLYFPLVLAIYFLLKKYR